MDDLGVKIIMITSRSPVFKGIATILAGAAALLFALYMKKKKHEPVSFGFRVFIYLAVLIVIYGLFILVLRPEWWLPPYSADILVD